MSGLLVEAPRGAVPSSTSSMWSTRDRDPHRVSQDSSDSCMCHEFTLWWRLSQRKKSHIIRFVTFPQNIMEGPKAYRSLEKTIIIPFHSIVLLSSFVFSFGGIAQQSMNTSSSHSALLLQILKTYKRRTVWPTRLTKEAWPSSSVIVVFYFIQNWFALISRYEEVFAKVTALGLSFISKYVLSGVVFLYIRE